MIEALRELWAWSREHGWMLFLTTVAAFSQLHYDLYGPPPHVLVLPGLAVAVFLVLPLWAAVVHDTHDALGLALASTGASIAMGPAIVWCLPEGKEVLRADAWPLVAGSAVGLGLVMAGAVRGGLSFAGWGLGPGEWRTWRRPMGFIVLGIVVLVPLVALAFPSFVEYYPRNGPSRTDPFALLRYEVAMGVYMLSWEFLFRGYLLFGLARTLGPTAAILVQAFPFFLLHDNKPLPEMVSSWVGGVVLGWFCWRSRCMWPGFLLHWPLYVTMEVSAFVLRRWHWVG